MKVKQAIKHFTLLSMVAVGLSACSLTGESEEQPEQPVVEPAIEEVVEEPAIDESVIEKPVVPESAVINNGVIDIPVMADAKIFAEFSDELPAVMNYFTSATKDEVIDFYQESFGEPSSEEMQRGRLTLKYQQADELIRVVISQQNTKRQVDIIVEANK